MNYYKIYYELCSKIKSLERIKMPYDGLERHHIFPKSLGGCNCKDNLVLLTPREHFIAHRLLVKINTGKAKARMVYALHQMLSNNKQQNRKFMTARHYEVVRIQYYLHRKELRELRSINPPKMSEENREKLSKRMRGDSNPSRKNSVWNKGKKGEYHIHSEENRKNISLRNKGKTRSTEARQKMSLSAKRKPKSEEHKKKISESLKGRKIPKHIAAKSAASRKGMIPPLLICPHCNLEGRGSAMRRWHFDRCKLKHDN